WVAALPAKGVSRARRRRGAQSGPERPAGPRFSSKPWSRPSSDERAVDQGGSALATDVVGRPYAEIFVQLLGGHLLHRARTRGGAWRRLGKCRRRRSMKSHVPLDLLDDLVDVPVEHGHRTEPLQIAERATGVGGAPAPLLVDRPQWQVGHQHDRGARRAAGNILLQPFELLVAHPPEDGGFEARLKFE